MNFDLAADLSQAVSSHSRRASSSTASHRFSAASFPNANLQVVPTCNLDELHVCPLWKRLMIFDDWPNVLDWELVHVFDEDHAMWVSHGEAGDLVGFFVYAPILVH